MTTYQYENCIVRVHRADIDETERNRRMKALQRATEQFMKAVIDTERKRGLTHGKESH